MVWGSIRWTGQKCFWPSWIVLSGWKGWILPVSRFVITQRLILLIMVLLAPLPPEQPWLPGRRRRMARSGWIRNRKSLYIVLPYGQKKPDVKWESLLVSGWIMPLRRRFTGISPGGRCISSWGKMPSRPGLIYMAVEVLFNPYPRKIPRIFLICCMSRDIWLFGETRCFGKRWLSCLNWWSFKADYRQRYLTR